MALIVKLIALLTLARRKFDIRHVRLLLPFIDNGTEFEVRLHTSSDYKCEEFYEVKNFKGRDILEYTGKSSP